MFEIILTDEKNIDNKKDLFPFNMVKIMNYTLNIDKRKNMFVMIIINYYCK